ncbi:MAG: 2OG-Fe(II) oxygenase [Gammaproteobacteria bacterium]|tara:strand:- start:121 stop:735 length:615 start_codon:yes stop_codon:yes gene_type:complete
MGALIDLNSIKSAPVDDAFFPFFSVPNCMLDHDKSIAKDFPDLEKGGSYPSNLPGLSDKIKQLISEIESDAMKEVLSKKFQVDLSNTEVITTLRGYSRMKDGKIHTDSKSKVLTFLLYLNEEWNNEKGLLRMLKNDFDLEDFIREIPASFGSLVVFKVTENCWHGFHPVEGKRLSMQMNYVKKESAASHKIRHGLSSFLKKLFS